MAGAGYGVATAGATGSSDQYASGAKPYVGGTPAAHRSSGVHHAAAIRHGAAVEHARSAHRTADIRSAAVTPHATDPYETEAATLAVELQEAVTYLGQYQTALATDSSTISTQAKQIEALLRDDLMKLLAPSGSYLKTSTLAKAKRVSFKFVSPGSGKLKVTWKASARGKRSTYYVNYGGSLRKLGDIIVGLPTTGSGRALMRGAKDARITAVVTFTTTSNVVMQVSRSFNLQG